MTNNVIIDNLKTDNTNLFIIKGSGQGIQFRNGGNNDKVRITNAGNVGIGTTSPGAKLQVAGDIQLSDTAVGTTGFRLWNDPGDGLRLQAGTVNNGVGIQVGGSMRFAVDTDNDFAGGVFQWVRGSLGFQTDLMTLTNSGSLGIGTVSPGHKLHIFGGVGIGDGNAAAPSEALKFHGTGPGGFDNSDPIFFYRVNGGSDVSELRLRIGDDQQANDKFVVGVWDACCGLPDVENFIVRANGNGSIRGNFSVGGVLSKGSGTFEIDHPQDPKNKILRHSFVESPEMKNVYDGILVLDEDGEGKVELPGYFEALNRDFRYQLTPIGSAAPGLYIKSKIRKGIFIIGGGKPDQEVCWQVTGVRQDAFAQRHPIIVEEEKGANKGAYLHPEAFVNQ